MRIGLDFDNTIISYDSVFVAAAKERSLLASRRCGTKREVRDAIRLLPDGEIAWQRLQGHVYGKGISAALMFPGVETFLRRARAEGETVLIVSHKTEHGHFDPERLSLREAALEWMRAHGLFQDDGAGPLVEKVYFESTRAEKLRRIADLGCEVFVDDLEEVLSDADFPRGVRRILFSEDGRPALDLPYPVRASWAGVEEEIFGGRA